MVNEPLHIPDAALTAADRYIVDPLITRAVLRAGGPALIAAYLREKAADMNCLDDGALLRDLADELDPPQETADPNGDHR